MNLDGALQTFFAEAEDLLNSMEAALLRLDEGEKDMETINEIFRAAHTIKGSAGLFGLNDIVGSPLWMAPEMIMQEGYGRKIDIWSTFKAKFSTSTNYILTIQI